MIEKYTFSQLARRYCDRQDSTPQQLLNRLLNQRSEFLPDGWVLAEAQLLDSSWLGSLVVVPYGPNNTFKTIPDHPFSPRGLASDTSVVVAYMDTNDLPSTLPDDLKDWTAPPPPKKTRKKRSAK